MLARFLANKFSTHQRVRSGAVQARVTQAGSRAQHLQMPQVSGSTFGFIDTRHFGRKP
jgi:hypothetical protein